ncbi:transcription initiation factor TFIID subunit 4-like [Ptychodera flava]|uniref:transcription initiation factor TFIID subunit 4-like n=1 Tax=Ptychodera flava TaxID=63121 RepID=UPI00396A8C20
MHISGFKMASADSSLEEIFTSDIDESAVNALVGSLEAHLASQTVGVQPGQVSTNSVGNNHVGSATISTTNVLQSKSAQQAQKPGTNGNSNSLSNSPLNAVDQAKNSASTQPVTINSVVVSSVGATPTAVATPTTKPQAQVSTATPTTCVRIITLPTASGRQVLATQNLANVNLLQNVTKSVTMPSTTPVIGARTVVSNVNAPGTVMASTTNVNTSSTPTVLRIVTTQGIQTNVSTTVPTTSAHSLNTKISTPGKLTVREQLAQAQQNSVTKPQQSIPQHVIIKQEPKVQTQQTIAVPQSTMTAVKSTVSNSPQYVTVNVGGQGTITLPSTALSGSTTRVITTTHPQMQQKLAPRVVSTPIRIAAVPQAIAPRPAGVTVPPGMNLPQGMVLVKQEGGGVQLIPNAAVAGALQPRPNVTSPATYRFTTVQPGTQVVTAQPQQVSVQQSTGQPQVVQSVVPQGAVQKTATSQSATTQHIQTATPIVIGVQHVQKAMSAASAHSASATASPIVTMASATHGAASTSVTVATTTMTGSRPVAHVVPATATAAGVTNVNAASTTVPVTQQSIPVSQSAMENVKKCRNFLTTLIKLASNQPPETIKNVKELVQSLIDDKIQPEEFTLQLQKELKSSPQPYLVPFLKRSLPLLRQTLHKTPIQGLRPPNLLTINTTSMVTGPAVTTVSSGAITTAAPATVTITQQQFEQLQKQKHVQQIKLQPDQLIKAHQQVKPQVPGIRHIVVSQHGTTSGVMTTANQLTALKQIKGRTAITTVASTPSSHKDKSKYSSTFRDDDDINDVASMAGVNLSEESARILATNAEFIGTQVRSCKDEQFLHMSPLQRKLAEIAKKHGLDEPSSEICNMVSHATQERLKNLIGKLALIAQHRMEIYKNDSRYDVTSDVKSKLKFLEQLDALERKRHDEQEREMLLRAAKSRSRQEDPEQLRLKQRAKEMQMMEMEQMRKRDANQTALLAIGPRKKRKLDSPIPGSSSSTMTQGSNGNGSGSSTSTMSSRPQLKRVKRVNLRDLIFLMEQERETKKSALLYKAFLK